MWGFKGKNDNCDGSGPCELGEVRVLPLGSSPHHGNLILCSTCFEREIKYRRERNQELSKDCQYSLPSWWDCKVYNS